MSHKGEVTGRTQKDFLKKIIIVRISILWIYCIDIFSFFLLRPFTIFLLVTKYIPPFSYSV